MKNTLKGYLIGVLSTVMLLGSIAYAASTTKTIEVLYDNIKVYKDNVLCETKDANGTVVEPFIYNGTTYMPVRGTANLAGMDVTWDGATKSVYLWDERTAEDTYLLDVCPPYSFDFPNGKTYMSTQGDFFEMSNKKYTNGFSTAGYGGTVLFNLNSKYKKIECTIGHIKGHKNEKSVSFIVDGKNVKTVELEPECLPKKVSIDLDYGMQLKIVAKDKYSNADQLGIGNIVVE